MPMSGKRSDYAPGDEMEPQLRIILHRTLALDAALVADEIETLLYPYEDRDASKDGGADCYPQVEAPTLLAGQKKECRPAQ